MGAARGQWGKGQLEARWEYQGPDGGRGTNTLVRWDTRDGIPDRDGVPYRSGVLVMGWDTRQGMGFQTGDDGVPDTDGGVPDRG